MSMDYLLASDLRAIVTPGMLPGVEAVLYTPRTGEPRTINAQVWRTAPDPMMGNAMGAAVVVRAYVVRHATEGIVTVNLGGDTISVAPRKGGAPVAMPISQILSEDAGGMELLLG